MHCRLRCSGPKIRNIGAVGPLGLIMVWALGNDSLTSTGGLFKELDTMIEQGIRSAKMEEPNRPPSYSCLQFP